MSTALKVDEGVNGNKFYQLLQNYQNEDFGGGYLRLLHFDLDAGTVSAEMYSPFYKKTKQDESRFSIENLEVVFPKFKRK